MSDEKKVDCGCGGRSILRQKSLSNGCGCSKPNGECEGNASGGDACSRAGSFGEDVAAGAILKMGNAVREEKKDGDSEITEADIDGFIEKCGKEGKDPLDVVKFIAEMNGIDMYSECVPKDASKRGLYDLLKGVVEKVIVGFVSYCADNYGLGFLRSLIGSCGYFRDSEKSSRSSGNGPDASVEVRPVSVPLFPVRVGYAFTW